MFECQTLKNQQYLPLADRNLRKSAAILLKKLKPKTVLNSLLASLRGQRLLAFAGIGRPEKFFETCRALDAELVGTAPFPDHHRYRPADVATLLARARALNAVPVTTAKDGVRLPDAIRREVRVLPVTLTWRDPEAMAKLLQTAILSPAPGAFTPGSHQRPEALGPHV